MRTARARWRSCFFCAVAMLCVQPRVFAAQQRGASITNPAQTTDIAFTRSECAGAISQASLAASFLDPAAARRELHDANRRMYLALPAILILYYGIFWLLGRHRADAPPIATQYVFAGDSPCRSLRSECRWSPTSCAAE